MEILASLNIDQTFFVHFILFTLVYMFLYFLVFKPYFKAYTKRQERTVGTTDFAERIIAETKDLETTYESKARTMSVEFKNLYDSSRTEALKEHDKVVNEARTKAKAILEKGRTALNLEIDDARKSLAEETAAVSSAIVNKVLGKELKL